MFRAQALSVGVRPRHWCGSNSVTDRIRPRASGEYGSGVGALGHCERFGGLGTSEVVARDKEGAGECRLPALVQRLCSFLTRRRPHYSVVPNADRK